MKLSNNEEAIKQANRLGYEHIRKSTGVAELFGVVGVSLERSTVTSSGSGSWLQLV